jgi:lycopene beta-cyclase
MKYFGFLARFVVAPLLVMGLLTWWDRRQGKKLPQSLSNYPEIGTLMAHAAVAVAYTTPWDNYLVATRVWWYDPKLVTGITFGWVPLEEYCFFVLQSFLTGLWTLWWAKRVAVEDYTPYQPSLGKRLAATGALGVVWAGAVASLFAKQSRNNYMGLMLAWALPPIMIQTVLGGDILWRQRKLVATALIPSTLYLAAADSLAIGGGTWTINPEQTTQIELPNKLPLEEGLFFLLTNMLLVFGMILVLSPESENRIPATMRAAYFRLKRALLKG